MIETLLSVLFAIVLCGGIVVAAVATFGVLAICGALVVTAWKAARK